MFEYFVNQMYIEWFTDEDVKRWKIRPDKVCIINKNLRSYKKFLWAYNKSIENYFKNALP